MLEYWHQLYVIKGEEGLNISSLISRYVVALNKFGDQERKCPKFDLEVTLTSQKVVIKNSRHHFLDIYQRSYVPSCTLN